MNILPTCSAKYCQIFNIADEYLKKPKPGAQLTFDKITENLRMFDSNDLRSWQILAFIVTTLVSDVLAVLLDPSNKGPPLFIGSDAT